MQATRILPDLQCSLLCEDIRQEVTGNLILIGVLQLIRVPQLPVTAFKICVVNRWTAGVGQFTESFRLLAPDIPHFEDLRSRRRFSRARRFTRRNPFNGTGLSHSSF